jgi:hypothetical protein
VRQSGKKLCVLVILDSRFFVHAEVRINSP